nr:hypothetical protein [Tanacetum cinerariifolium]
TNEPVSTVASVSAASAKFLFLFFPMWIPYRTGRNLRANAPTSMRFDMSKVECYNCHMKGYFAREFRSPKDTRGNVVVEPQRRNVTVKTSTSNALVLQCDGVGSYGWSFQAEEEPTNYALMAFTSSSSFSYDNEVVSCSKACTKAYATLHSHYDKLTDDFIKSQFDVISYKTGLESVEARLLVYQQNRSVFEEDIKLLKLEVQLRDNALVILRQKFKKAEQERADLKLKLEKPSVKTIETSIPDASHKTAIPKSHGTNRNRKACFVCKSLTHLIKHYDYYEKKIAQTPAKNHAQRGNHQQLTIPNPQRHVVPTVVLTKSNLVPLTTARQVTTAVSSNHVTRPRPAKTVVTKSHSPPRRNINRSPSPKASTFPLKVNAAKAPMVNVVKGVQGNCVRKPKCPILDHGNSQHALKDKEVIDCGYSRHMTGNMSYLSDFKEINGRYVTFGGNPKGGKISGKGKIKTGNLDFDDVYFVKELNFNLFSVLQMCDKKNNILITDTECIVLSLEFKLPYENQVLLRVPRENNMYNVDLKNIVPFEKAGEDNVQQYVFFPVWSSASKNPQNTDDDAAFGGKKPEFEGRKPESEVYVSPSSSAQTKKHDDKSKREDKGKSPVELSTGYRNLSVEFEDFSENSINEVNTDDSLVPTVGQISTNSTNTFSVAGPSNADVKLEDITYYDDEEDVGAEADFTNLETTITVSPIPITRVHKDHPVTQIIGGAFSIQDAEVARIEAIRLFLAYASFMGFMVYQMDVKSAFLYGTIEEKVYVCQPPGFEDLYYPNKVYKVVKIYVDDIIFGSTDKYLCKDFEKLMKDKFQMSSMGELTFFLGLQVKQKTDGIFISQDKYVADILRKFGLTDGKTASTPIDTEKPLLKDPNVAYLDSDYAGASLDKKSTTWGCQFLGCRLISWQCKKQTVVATLSTKAEYVAAISCCARVLWIQNQLLDYGLTMQVEQSSMKSLKRNLHVTNILSVGYLTTSQMVLNSPCLTNIKN